MALTKKYLYSSKGVGLKIRTGTTITLFLLGIAQQSSLAFVAGEEDNNVLQVRKV